LKLGPTKKATARARVHAWRVYMYSKIMLTRWGCKERFFFLFSENRPGKGYVAWKIQRITVTCLGGIKPWKHMGCFLFLLYVMPTTPLTCPNPTLFLLSLIHKNFLSFGIHRVHHLGPNTYVSLFNFSSISPCVVLENNKNSCPHIRLRLCQGMRIRLYYVNPNLTHFNQTDQKPQP
jgi:hypothetical protein